MNEMEKRQEKKEQEKFNNVTQKTKPENQNQTHNSVQEGMGSNTMRRPK